MDAEGQEGSRSDCGRRGNLHLQSLNGDDRGHWWSGERYNPELSQYGQTSRVHYHQNILLDSFAISELVKTCLTTELVSPFKEYALNECHKGSSVRMFLTNSARCYVSNISVNQVTLCIF